MKFAKTKKLPARPPRPDDPVNAFPDRQLCLWRRPTLDAVFFWPEGLAMMKQVPCQFRRTPDFNYESAGYLHFGEIADFASLAKS